MNKENVLLKFTDWLDKFEDNGEFELIEDGYRIYGMSKNIMK